MSKVQQALDTYKSGCNCAQALLTTYAPDVGLDPATACKLATGFGGGMRMGSACGALSGAIMVLSLKFGSQDANSPDQKARTYRLVEELTKAFEARNGSTQCTDLLGCDITTPEGLAQARERNRFACLCPKMVQDAAEILEDILAKNPS